MCVCLCIMAVLLLANGDYNNVVYSTVSMMMIVFYMGQQIRVYHSTLYLMKCQAGKRLHVDMH